MDEGNRLKKFRNIQKGREESTAWSKITSLNTYYEVLSIQIALLCCDMVVIKEALY